MYQIQYSDRLNSMHRTAQSAKRKLDSFYGTCGVVTKIVSLRYGVISPFELAQFAKLERAERAHNRKELASFR